MKQVKWSLQDMAWKGDGTAIFLKAQGLSALHKAVGAAAVPQHPKVFRKKLWTVALWMCAVHSALGLFWAALPSPGWRDTGCSCAFVPSCVGIIAGMVCSMFGLCLCSVCSLWCSHCWPRRVFACIPFFRRYRQNQCSPDSLFRALKCSWISTLPSACDRA